MEDWLKWKPDQLKPIFKSLHKHSSILFNTYASKQSHVVEAHFAHQHLTGEIDLNPDLANQRLGVCNY